MALVVAADTMLAVLAGVVIFPAMFAMGMVPDSGPTLLFVSMPAMFAAMPGGRIFGFLFFSLLTVAAVTSVIAAFELLTSVLKDTGKLTRTGAATLVGVYAWIASSSRHPNRRSLVGYHHRGHGRLRLRRQPSQGTTCSPWEASSSRFTSRSGGGGRRSRRKPTLAREG